MNILGIKFAPLNIPLERRLQTLAAGCWFTTLAFGTFIGTFIWVYFFFTRFWYLSVLYATIIYLEKDRCETGGRPIEWIRHWKWWWYLKNYFPCKLDFVPGLTFDPKRNYLFACYPHGILPAGPFNTIGSPYSEFSKLFPKFQVRLVTLRQHFFIPFLREIAYGTGGISASAKSMNYVLGNPEGGNIAVLMPGGAVEAYHSRPGQYRIVLKNRKGFVKLALKNGSPLVPVISFGEPELFDQIEGKTLRRIQESIRKYLGLAPVIFSGRGFFQYSFGVIPQRSPITTVVGNPIEVTKTEKPTNEEVDELHKKYMQELENLFEVYKYKYLENPNDIHLKFE
ncbi:2-acylglycerol O-acyltransferase 2-like [Tribolium madens]|uniref:2-acylglycerol O-acyltransferase 2-like n=1 Tax=Tribolium madens TaxID=41895 RepID=UPI001CF727EC|nr:2-acylglycerol O-acyltransferase 2-like [Tribolium madens]XP_044258048.1 2-acylglycerol O-acyltransferase 2-like [Tribolium madens]XP_044258049.1 2-acylglycerol O-acyltransferase 2-like [Tribolium madens]